MKFRACLNFAFELTASKYYSARGRRREHSLSYVTDAQRSTEQYLPLVGQSVKFKQALCQIILWLFTSLVITAQPEFSLKSGERLSHMNQFGQSTAQLEAFVKANPNRLYDQSEALLLISYNYMQLGDYANALRANETSLAIKAKLHADDLVTNYVRFGAIHILRGNYHTALSYLLRAKDFPIEALQLYAVIDGYLAAAYEGLGQFDEAESHYQQSIETFLIEYPHDHPDIITSFYKLGKLYLAWDKPMEARRYFQQGLERSKLSSEQAFLQALLYNGLGESYPGDLSQAASYHQKALEVAIRFFGTYHRETAQASIYLAQLFLKQERWEEAKEAIQNAIRSLQPEQTNLSWDQMPDTANIVIDKLLLAEALGIKAKWLLHSAVPGTQETSFALTNSEFSGRYLKATLDEQGDQGDRLQLLEVARNAFEPGIVAGVKLWEANRDAVAQQRAFHLIELMKLLRFRIHTSNTLALSGAFAEKERIALRELKLAEMNFRLQPLDVTVRKAVSGKRARYQQSLNEWQSEAPISFQERFGIPALPLADLQKNIDASTALLSYFVGKNDHYLFILSQEAIHSFTLPSSVAVAKLEEQNLDSDIERFVQAIDSSDASNFVRYAHQVYAQLLAPATLVLKSKKALVILPDEPLYDLPFEALLVKSYKKGNIRFHKLPYLIKDFAISYHYTNTVWATTSAPSSLNPSHDLLFLSPEFDREALKEIPSEKKVFFDPTIHPTSIASEGEGFPTLTQAELEAKELQHLFDENKVESLFKLGEDAQAGLLKEEIGKTHLIHLASYGFIVGALPGEAGLVLSSSGLAENSAKDGIVLASDLLALPHAQATDLLSIDFVATEKNKLTGSAGVEPLTGSLFLSGISNILLSTRLVNQQSSVFPIFYEYLLEEEPIKQALQATKRKLIRKQETATPNIWCGYRLYGK